MPVRPVLIGSLGWVAAVAAGRKRMGWSVGLATLVVAAPFVVLFLPFLPGTFMSDGLKSVAILAAAWVPLLGVLLPAVDGLNVRTRAAV